MHLDRGTTDRIRGASGSASSALTRDARSDEARRRARLSHRMVRGAPFSGGTIALPGAGGADRRAHPGHRAHPSRLRRHAAAVRIHAPGAGRGEGGDADILSQRPHRVGHGPVDADGTDRVPCRPRRESRRVGRSDRDHLQHVARRALRVGQPDVPVPRALHHAEAVPGPASALLDGGYLAKGRQRWRAANGSACSRSRSCNRSRRWRQQIERVPGG